MKTKGLLAIAWASLLAFSSVSANEIAEQLERMLVQDQEIRSALNAHRPGSPEWKSLSVEMSRIDSENLVKLEEIIAEHGWPSASRFGAQSSKAAFLIIQHAELQHQKRYLPIVREAVAKGNLSRSSLALLEDRILMREGKEQIYGSQLTQSDDGSLRLWPIRNEKEVDARRIEVGLEPLAQYLKRFGLTYSTKGEQGGAVHSAAAPESTPRGREEPVPESEGRPE